MDSNFRNNIENISVGIFKIENSYTAKILPFDNVEHPVYIRSFPEMVLALGYCNVINKLSKKSVEKIMQMNIVLFN
jgi:hypothetical protein